jgi:hypothetical protein
MKDENARQLLAKVMSWEEVDVTASGIRSGVSNLQLLADFKYDHYQRFEPGKRFIESLALWLRQFDKKDRETAFNFVTDQLVFFSDKELSHLVRTAYPDCILQERIRLVADEQGIPRHRVGEIVTHRRFRELGLKSLYLGLSDGARTNELRRASDGGISNEQIWHAYELGELKADDMVSELRKALETESFPHATQKFTLIWLLDDFSGSGNTYIRYDSDKHEFKGKIRKIYDQLEGGRLVDKSHHEVILLLYVATRQAIDHIEYWSERFTSERGYKPLGIRVLCPIEPDAVVWDAAYPELAKIVGNSRYCDNSVVDVHFLVGGAKSAERGFAGCALPVVLSHNAPNNSFYILWGPESSKLFVGLFPRISRHRQF